VVATALAWFLSGDFSRYMDNAGVIAESETMVEQQRDVKRCKTLLTDVLPLSFTDPHQRFFVRLKHNKQLRQSNIQRRGSTADKTCRTFTPSNTRYNFTTHRHNWILTHLQISLSYA